MVQPPAVHALVSGLSTPRPSGSRSVPPMLGSLEDGDDTKVDGRRCRGRRSPPSIGAATAAARTPYLATPPEMTGFEARAQGSTVSPVPPYQKPRHRGRRRSRSSSGCSSMMAWGAALLVSGVGLGWLGRVAC